MASTVLPNGIIIPEKYSRDWYADLYHNWQELDNLLGGGTPKDGTLTIQKNGSTVGTFSANQATDETINLSVPTKTSDLTNDSGFITEDNTKIPLSGTNALAGSIVPSTDNAYDFGSSSYKLRYVYCNTAYVTNLNINGKTIGTDANSNMTYDGHIVETIEEQGNDYIRYSSGLQICWGSVVSQTQQISVTFGKAFLGLVSYGIGVCPSDNVNCWISGRSATGITLSTEMGDGYYRRMDWLAIGMWK